MIYTDGTHIISDAGVQELHWFAERLGIGQFYFDKDRAIYKKPKQMPSYMLTEKGAKWSWRKIQERLTP